MDTSKVETGKIRSKLTWTWFTPEQVEQMREHALDLYEALDIARDSLESYARCLGLSSPPAVKIVREVLGRISKK